MLGLLIRNRIRILDDEEVLRNGSSSNERLQDG